jgi:tetratricopeptide (TPR) repeat protein
MDFLKKLFGRSTKASTVAHDMSNHTTESLQPVQISLRAQVLMELRICWDSDSGKANTIKKELAEKGTLYLQSLKEIALDQSVDLNLRKLAIACGVEFVDDEYARFLSENFINGKDPKALIAEGRKGNAKAEADYCLYHQAEDCLDQMMQKLKHELEIIEQLVKAATSAGNAMDCRQTINLTTQALKSPRLTREKQAHMYYLRGWAFGHSGDLSSALSDYTHAIELDGGLRWTFSSYVNRANCYRHLREFDHALSDINHALSLQPGHSTALCEHRRILSDMKV